MRNFDTGTKGQRRITNAHLALSNTHSFQQKRNDNVQSVFHMLYTVNSEISRGFYFRETSHVRSFVKIKLSQNGDTTLPFTDIGKSCLVA